ncbi:aconitate hydratase AcnA [Ureibacillus sp. FSL K6-8385]|uniref:Aconitate hydratase n=1 Tax=Ureibacillus terrenus TaxID=118246 RepID=A0A540V3L2_9BACL|nr:aconitate hydratase AcnA [Ureibacillus terrenus]MED3661865.1 aconitate hydratase AcnA [Ureibacillus terrenus]MED3763166.1 aconitate hydratase AcnA [Ureibacillus terrenus]TQE91329.1 aconitate hydratase AcnA [Ureibacillus terrenus]
MNKETIVTEFESFQINSLRRLGSSASFSELPYTVLILLESIIRNREKTGIGEEELEEILKSAAEKKRMDIPFVPTRVIMQDASGIPALVDLVSLRGKVRDWGMDPSHVHPEIPVALVIDHSVQVDDYGSEGSFERNLNLEYARNKERYGLLKWAQNAFKGLSVVPPGNGIIHQVNLEYLTKIIELDSKTNMAYPELIIGTDSHTTMVNALGVLGWGVGGIEAEAAMLGLPISIAMPEVIGVEIKGRPKEGVTATDIALTLTQMLRKRNVVGKFVEFFGPGLKELSVPDRATISNMAPEYGATCGFFPVDEETLKYLRLTGKPEEDVARVEHYCKAQGLFYTGENSRNKQYDDVLDFDLGMVEPSVAGPKRPQDRIPLQLTKDSFPVPLSSGSGKKAIVNGVTLEDGSIVIAAITSCTNTSNPFNMIGAGLLAKKAVERGLSVSSAIQTSLSPGSKVVTGYLEKTGLMPYLEKLGFHLTGYGCSVCVGNTGSLDPAVEHAVQQSDLTVAAVLSGNRNFEGRIHPLVKANYLASPPLVIAYAIAGTMNIDLTSEPIGKGKNGEDVYLKDIWPKSEEIIRLIGQSISSDLFQTAYRNIFAGNEKWQALPYKEQPVFEWDERSSYFKPSPFFGDAEGERAGNIADARVLLVLGDSITTDHISPVGSIPKDSIAGKYLLEQGVAASEFNTFGSRRGNHEVLVRGTFSNIRLKNALSSRTGGYTRHFPSGKEMDVYTAAQLYKKDNIPLIIIAGQEYGTGSARDWAAKGTYLLGVKAVIAESFERIHRSNLVMMGVLPVQFMPGENAESLQLTGEELYNIYGLEEPLAPFKKVEVEAVKQDGSKRVFQAVLRLDTKHEIELYRKRGIFRSIIQKWKQQVKV